MVNDAFSRVMEPQRRAVREAEQTVARVMRQIGLSEAVSRFMSRCAKIRTQKAYSLHLLAWQDAFLSYSVSSALSRRLKSSWEFH